MADKKWSIKVDGKEFATVQEAISSLKVGEIRGGTLILGVDLSETIKGLKAVKKAAGDVLKALKDLDSTHTNILIDAEARYVAELFKLCRQNKETEFRYTELNKRLFDAVIGDFDRVVVRKSRGEGFTTSAIAVAKTFENVWLVVSSEDLADRIRKEYGVPTLSYKNFPANVRGLSTRINTVIIDVEDHDISKIPPWMFEKVILATDRSGSPL